MEELDPKESAPAPSIVMEGEHKISDPAQIAETFNAFLINIVSKYILNTGKPIRNYDKLITFIESSGVT